MLTSLNRMIGLPAVLDGKSCGSVERAVMDARMRRLRGVVIRRGLGGARWAGASALELIGHSCVLLRQPPSRPPKLKDDGGAMAYSTGGDPIGEVTDALLRGDTLRLVALEVSAGPLYRLMGRSAYATDYQARHQQGAVVVNHLVSWAELIKTLGEGDAT